jgi:hypothetical protein
LRLYLLNRGIHGGWDGYREWLLGTEAIVYTGCRVCGLKYTAYLLERNIWPKDNDEAVKSSIEL